MLIDTGSTFTLISSNLWKKCVAGSSCISLRKFEEPLVSASNETIQTLGCSTLILQLGSCIVKHSVVVANDLSHECIVGLDFLGSENATINLGTMSLEIHGSKVPLMKDKKYIFCRVAVAETVTIPSGYEMILPGKLVDRKRNLKVLHDNKTGIMEPLQKTTRNGTLVARVFTTSKGNKVPLRVANFSDEDVTLFKNSNVATFEEVQNTEVKVANKGLVSTIDKGKRVFEQINIEGGDLSNPQKHRFEKLVCQYDDIFSRGPNDIGRTSRIQHKIDTGEANPIRQGARRVPFSKEKEIKDQIDEMLSNDIIRPSFSPWAAPVLLVPKKDGSSRFCIDYRKLNDVTKKDAYPIPRIDQTLDSLSGATLFSTLDLASGYWQVEMSPSDREKTAFATRSGLYEFNVMPFGLTGAPGTFQRLMEAVLAGLQYDICLIYLDDIIIFSKTFEEHMKRLEEIFGRLREANLKIKPQKCHFFCSSLKYLGHIISSEGVQTDPAKIQTIKEWPKPINTEEVQRFLGLCTYYRRFVKDFSKIASPLYKLTQKNVEFRWNSECEAAFSLLKTELVNAPVLKYPDFTKPFILDTDASEMGIGAVLSQNIDGREYVVAYGSRALLKSEKNYCVTRKELLALVYFIKYFKHFLYGNEFVVRTDHKALKWLYNFKEPEGQLARWLTSLAEYTFEIVHREGRKHSNADALSRIPCRQCGLLDSSTVNSVNIRIDSIVNENGLINVDEIREAQKADVDISAIVKLKEEGRKPSSQEIESRSPQYKDLWSRWDQLELKDGILVLVWEKGQGICTKIVLPRALITHVLTELHNSQLGGHLGVRKTLARVQIRFYWLGVRKDVQIHCRNCSECMTRRGPHKKHKAPLQPHSSGYPFEKIALDILTLPISDKGNRYLLVVGDYFTKWVEVFPLVNHSALSIAEKLVDEFICRYGVPQQIHSDQGRDFQANVMQEICNILKIKKSKTTPYHPQSDGMIERMNRTIVDMLSKFVNENQKDWDEKLPKLMMAYRTSVHETTQFTPAYLMFGRELRLPIDIACSIPSSENQTTAQYAKRLQDTLHSTFEHVRDNVGQNQETMKEYYDKGCFGSPYEVGDRVLYFNDRVKKGQSKKLIRPWEGPYKIKKKISDLVYRIQKEGTRIMKVVHFNKLKPMSTDEENVNGDETMRNSRNGPNAKEEESSDGKKKLVGKGKKGLSGDVDSILSDETDDSAIDNGQQAAVQMSEQLNNPLTPPPTPMNQNVPVVDYNDLGHIQNHALAHLEDEEDMDDGDDGDAAAWNNVGQQADNAEQSESADDFVECTTGQLGKDKDDGRQTNGTHPKGLHEQRGHGHGREEMDTLDAGHNIKCAKDSDRQACPGNEGNRHSVRVRKKPTWMEDYDMEDYDT